MMYQIVLHVSCHFVHISVCKLRKLPPKNVNPFMSMNPVAKCVALDSCMFAISHIGSTRNKQRMASFVYIYFLVFMYNALKSEFLSTTKTFLLQSLICPGSTH